MPEFFSSALATLEFYRYPLVFLGAIVEGPILMMASGVLLHVGNFSFLPLYITLILGDFAADIIWYAVGYKAAEPFLRRFGHFFGVSRSVFLKMEEVFRRHDAKILFISKITMGFGFAIATLMAAGAMRVSFRKFLVLNLMGGFIWTGLLIAVGYFLGNAYMLVDKSLKVLFIIAVSIIIFSLFYGFILFLRRKYGGQLK